MKKYILFLLLLFTNYLFAQKKCVSGDCVNGFGKMTDESGKEVYEGNWKNGMKEGKGTFTDLYETYTGNWHEDMKQGLGENKKLLKHDGKITVSEIYTGNFYQLDYNGQGKCTMFTDWGEKIAFVMEGNFSSHQLSGKGSLMISDEGTYYSDNFTDNFNFTSGKFIKESTKETAQGSFANGTFKKDESNAASTSMVSNNKNTNNSSGSMLDYGVFNTKKPDNAVATKITHDYKVYCFVTTCSQGKRSFKVLSKITADINKHSFDEIKNEVAHRISNNGWFAQSNMDYLGTADNLNITGKAGRDYVVSESDLYDFK